MGVKHKVVQDITWDYRRSDPIPSDDEMTQFYQSHYYDLIREGGRPHHLGSQFTGLLWKNLFKVAIQTV
jgi:hypothetical protein